MSHGWHSSPLGNPGSLVYGMMYRDERSVFSSSPLGFVLGDFDFPPLASVGPFYNIGLRRALMGGREPLLATALAIALPP